MIVWFSNAGTAGEMHVCVHVHVFVGQEERGRTENCKVFSSGANQEAKTPPLLA